MDCDGERPEFLTTVVDNPQGWQFDRRIVGWLEQGQVKDISKKADSHRTAERTGYAGHRLRERARKLAPGGLHFCAPSRSRRFRALKVAHDRF
jgi:hypothetical protein